MSPSKKDKIAYVTALAEAKNNQNIARALEIYHENIEMIAPAFSAHARGRQQTGQQLEYFFRLFPDYSVRVSRYEEDGDVLMAFGFVSVTPHTVKGAAQLVEVPASMAFDFKDKAISREVFNIDLALVAERAGITLDDLLGAKEPPSQPS